VPKSDDLTTFIVPHVKKIRSLNLSDPHGPVQACSGIALQYRLRSSVLYHYDTLLCIVTSYGLDGPGLEPRWRQKDLSSSYPSIPFLGPTQPWVKWPGFNVGHSPSFRGTVKHYRTKICCLYQEKFRVSITLQE
jgi:hypothetical protein